MNNTKSLREEIQEILREHTQTILHKEGQRMVCGRGCPDLLLQLFQQWGLEMVGEDVEVIDDLDTLENHTKQEIRNRILQSTQG